MFEAQFPWLELNATLCADLKDGSRIVSSYKRYPFKHLFTQLDRLTLRHRFQGSLVTCAVLEEVFQQKPLKQYLCDNEIM